MAESLFSMSKSSSGVSYSQIYKSWLKKDQRVNVHSTIPVETILIKLSIRQVLTETDYALVNHEVTHEQKLLKLYIDILPSKDEQGFDQLVKILLENKCDGLANDLLMERKKLSGSDCSNEPPGDVIPKNTTSLRNQILEEDGQMLQAKTHLSRLLKKNVDFMAKYWSDVIPLAQTEAAFVQVQVLEHFKAANGNPVNSYREVFDKGENEIHPRMLIEADPGCGKTTYVNKLVLDWAKEDEYLREKFEFVFLIALQTLTMDVLDAIKWFLPDESEQFFASYAKSPDSKILLILDGFDELVDSSEWYLSVMTILEGKSKPFQFFHVIVTTRRSHVDKIPQQFRERSLLIKGFDEESMKQFLDKQHVPLPTVGQQSNLSHLLQTPLFCAIYCSLHFGEGRDRIALEDSYDLIKSLVENSVTNTVKNKTVVNVEEQLNEIGKFAFQMLDSESLNFVKKFCRSSKMIKPSFDLLKVNIDLLIKRRIPLVGVNCFKEDFGLPHQLIAEYLAARYFAGSLTEEQLKQADDSALIPGWFNPGLDLPFVRFFLSELLFLYLEKKYDDSIFDNFLILPQIRFFWNIKSNKDIIILDNVSDLNFGNWNSELVNHSRCTTTLSKCRHLSSLSLYRRDLFKNQVEQLVNYINNNCFQNLIELYLGLNENVGSTPQLFTALSKCKYLQTLDLNRCNLSVDSTNELARCIDNNILANLRQLNLFGNENVGSLTYLFHVLHKCRQLQELYLVSCSITQESFNIFLSTFNSNTFQQLVKIWLMGNREIKADDNYFIAFEKCSKISSVHLYSCKHVECNLSQVGRKAKETLEQRGCQFPFY